MKRSYRYHTPNASSAKVKAQPLPWTAARLGWDPMRPTPLSRLIDKIAEYMIR